MTVLTATYPSNTITAGRVGADTKSVLMKDIFNKVKAIAQLDKHIILIGETGVGKNRLARFIHKQSNRASGPFHSFYCIDVNEDEYKDAFRERIYYENEHLRLKFDLLEKAVGGVLYLDRFSELNSGLMNGIIESYINGCNQLFMYKPSISPRLIISVNLQAYHSLAESEPWANLLKSLSPISVMLPPLRERKEDIPVLAEEFVDEVRMAEPAWRNLNISAEAVNECMMYDWPGNIRQLKNAITQGAVLSYGQTIEPEHLPFSMNWKLPYNL